MAGEVLCLYKHCGIAAVAICLCQDTLRGLPFIYTGYIPGLAMNMEVIIDPLAAFFGLIFAFGFPWGLHYGSYYLKAHPNEGTAYQHAFGVDPAKQPDVYGSLGAYEYFLVFCHALRTAEQGNCG